jgi:anti-sigma B factor antagonist
MPNENIQIVASDGTAPGQRVLRLRGPLTIHTIFDFQAAIRAEESPLVIVDFTGVPYMDSAGLGALVGAHVSADRAHRKLALASMNDRLKALLAMTQVARLLHPYETVEDAQRGTAAPA